MKLLFPSELALIGDKLNTVVNYKAALTSLGEGISGEKKFTTALGEAFTYAFTGKPSELDDNQAQTSPSENGMPASNDNAAASDAITENDLNSAVTDTAATDASLTALETNEESAPVFAEDNADALNAGALNAGALDTSASDAADDEDSLSNAVITAFIQSQEEYSDYAIPAGVTYDMPRISIAYDSPLDGVVSSSFGYRIHPTLKSVKFHYGTDICAKKGTPITSFANGKVLAAGDSTTLGKYVIISHGDIESQYAHCASLFVTSGQTVAKGDKIATVGDTGNATETCLHFELKINGQYVNPEYYIKWE